MTPPRRAPPRPTIASILAAIDAEIRGLRDIPRECFRDPSELVHWKNRTARRLEVVRRDVAALPPPGPRLPPAASASPPRVATALERAQAVFSAGPRRPEVKTVVGRKGRSVRVEVMRARGAGQMELGL